MRRTVEVGEDSEAVSDTYEGLMVRCPFCRSFLSLSTWGECPMCSASYTTTVEFEREDLEAEP